MALRLIVPVDDLHKMMPCLNDLLSVHMNFLRLLKKRKDESVVVGAIHEDILAQVRKFRNKFRLLIRRKTCRFFSSSKMKSAIK